MGILYSGTDVRIARDGRVWVLVPAGADGPNARWQHVGPGEITLDADHPDQLITRYARHPVSDLGLDARQLSHLLGLSRRDPQRAAELWRPGKFIHGSTIAVDFDEKEFAPAADASPVPEVYPFSSVAGVVAEGEARLVLKYYGAGIRSHIPLGDFPVPAGAVARAMGVEVLTARHADEEEQEID